MLAKAFENARQRDHILRTIQADWRWLNRNREAAARHGLLELEVIELTNNLVVHYMRVREELARVRYELAGQVSDPYIERMLAGLGHWVEAGEKGYLRWGIPHFRKPAG
jgi:sarcosine/dimethylglycine N-methyltransferase